MSSKRLLIAIAALIFGVVSWRFFPELWGSGTWGAGGNMVAWVLCGYFAFSWQHAKAEARHRQLMDQNERHHQEMKRHVSMHLKKGSQHDQGD